jgi:hypothetical protein
LSAELVELLRLGGRQAGAQSQVLKSVHGLSRYGGLQPRFVGLSHPARTPVNGRLRHTAGGRFLPCVTRHEMPGLNRPRRQTPVNGRQYSYSLLPPAVHVDTYGALGVAAVAAHQPSAGTSPAVRRMSHRGRLAEVATRKVAHRPVPTQTSGVAPGHCLAMISPSRLPLFGLFLGRALYRRFTD